ncbi:MAG: hypothetical protein JRE27_03350 [Deltaproteobacteria bacterium]|nr:hypothetical protein [Deltaproteobacteria bacterium]
MVIISGIRITPQRPTFKKIHTGRDRWFSSKILDFSSLDQTDNLTALPTSVILIAVGHIRMEIAAIPLHIVIHPVIYTT